MKRKSDKSVNETIVGNEYWDSKQLGRKKKCKRLLYISLSQFSPLKSFVYASVTFSLHSTYAPIFIRHA